MSQEYQYTDAFEELQQLVADIESGAINIDELSEKIKRAAVLIQICRAKLTTTEDEVNALLQNINPVEEKSEDVDTETDLEEEEED